MLEYIRHLEELQFVSAIRENSRLYSFDSGVRFENSRLYSFDFKPIIADYLL